MALTLSQDELDELKISPQVAWYMQDWRLENFGAAIPLPKYPPAIKTPEPLLVPGAVFDAERVDRVLLAFENLRHTKGRWARKPLKPDPWQVAYIIAPTFGWVHPVEVEDEDGDYTEYVRIINNLYVEVPRKNGKTTIAGGLAIITRNLHVQVIDNANVLSVIPVLILNLNRMHPPKRRSDNVGNLPRVRLQRLTSPTALRVPKVLERQQYAVDALSIKHRARNMNRLRRFDSWRILRKRDCATKIL